MKSQHYQKLQQLLEGAFSAHRLADWDNKSARETIARTIVKRFKRYMKTQKND